MADENHYIDAQWTIQSISDNAALILYDADTAFVVGATADTFTMKALNGGHVAEDASVCHSQAGRSLTVNVTVGDSTTRLQAAFDGACVSLRYFRNNELVLEEDASVLAGYSAPARRIATDRQVYDQTVRLRWLIEKLREDTFFRQQVLRTFNQFADPSGFGPIDYCDWVCKQCWHGMYLPHSCIACIFCNGFTIDTGGGID